MSFKVVAPSSALIGGQEELGWCTRGYSGGFPKLGVPFGGPYNKDYSIWGSLLGSPYFGQLLFGVRAAADDGEKSTGQSDFVCNCRFCSKAC